MRVAVGTRIGPYEIIAPLGAGGMGEVYRARDPRLGREVAIKVLPGHLTESPEALARFEREAKAVAALNHPNILGIYDFTREGELVYAVMELLEGESVRSRLDQGPLGPRKAVALAVQMAQGLAAAHEKGVVHRDLKPENLWITKEGRLKILDFGLAKQVAGPDQACDSVSPTEAVDVGHRTAKGLVLGTIGYMSPEQVRGEAVDARSDIFSFGAVLYEMVTGRRAFRRPTASDTLAAILRDEPPEIEQSGPAVPGGLERLLRHCLEKEPAHRFQTARDLAFALESLSATSSSASSGAAAAVPRAGVFTRRRLVAAVLALAAIVTAIVITGLHIRSDRQRDKEAGRVVRLQVVPPAGERLSFAIQGDNSLRAFAISPDGSAVVYAVSKGVGTVLRIRTLDSPESREMPGTEGAQHPFFSPDGKWVAFAAAAKLKKIALSGGAPVTLCEVPMFRGGVWGDDGRIYLARNAYAPISRVSVEGGALQDVTRIRTEEGEQQHRWPELVPGSRILLYVIGSGGEWDDAAIVAERLDTGARKVIVKGGTFPRYLPTGHLLYGRAGALYAVAFDARSLAVEGSPIEVARGVFVDGMGIAHMDVSRTGTLLTAPSDSINTNLTLSWIRRDGTSEPLEVAPQGFRTPSISPDGRQVSLGIGNSIAVFDLSRRTLRKLSLSARAENPVWSADGRRLFFGLEKDRHYQIYSKAADDSGAEEKVVASSSWEEPVQRSADGKLLLTFRAPPDGQNELLLRERTEGAGGAEPKRLFKSIYIDYGLAAFSPDARWVVYQSKESGRSEIYVRPASGEDRKWQVSADGGAHPIWSPDGREIFYLCGMKFMALPVEAKGADVQVGAPKVLFENHEVICFDVSRDGKRFLVAESPDPGASPHLDVVLNWPEELKARVPAK